MVKISGLVRLGVPILIFLIKSFEKPYGSTFIFPLLGLSALVSLYCVGMMIVVSAAPILEACNKKIIIQNGKCLVY